MWSILASLFLVVDASNVSESWYKTLTPSDNNDLCIDVPGGYAYNGNSLWLWSCSGMASQIWVFDNWQVRYGADENYCLDAGDMGNGQQLFLWECNGYPQQTWAYDADAARVYLADTATCLDYYTSWDWDGQPLHVWDCNGYDSQYWSLWDSDAPWSPSPSPPSPSPAGGCDDCDCSWTHGGTDCGGDDGSHCWSCCCSGGPSPSPPPSPYPTPPSGAAFCPSDDDFQTDYGSPQFSGGGWTITGGARVSSRASFNLLGGYVEFDMDVSGAHGGVNQNLYVVAPDGDNCGKDCYCDAQCPSGKCCMELDFLETNGNCAWATTWHTQVDGGAVCDGDGCQYEGGAANQFHVHVDFSDDGWMTVIVNGQSVDAGSLSPAPSGQDASAIVNIAQTRGFVLESSQWTGWVPGSCSTGEMSSSQFSISNVRVQGSVVKGPQPQGC